MLQLEQREGSIVFSAEPEALVVSWPAEAISHGFCGLPDMRLPQMDFQLSVDVKEGSWSRMVLRYELDLVPE